MYRNLYSSAGLFVSNHHRLSLPSCCERSHAPLFHLPLLPHAPHASLFIHPQITALHRVQGRTPTHVDPSSASLMITDVLPNDVLQEILGSAKPMACTRECMSMMEICRVFSIPSPRHMTRVLWTWTHVGGAGRLASSACNVKNKP